MPRLPKQLIFVAAVAAAFLICSEWTTAKVAGVKGASFSYGESGVVQTPEQMAAAKERQGERGKRGRLRKDETGILDRGVLQSLFKDASSRIEVPGYVSLRQTAGLGKIVGPAANDDIQFNVGSRVYIRWSGITRPELGEIYATYSPTLLLQNKNDFTDFRTVLIQPNMKTEFDDFSLAGYIYSINGEIEITDISRGIVEGRVISMRSRVLLDDRVIKPLPRISNIEPIGSPIRLAAAVVAGEPREQLSAAIGSYVYINRGRRDGVRIGNIFQTADIVQLTDGPSIRKVGEHGEALVVHVSDAFSTGIIIKQFNQIRIGTLLESAVTGPNRASQFNVLGAGVRRRDGEAGMAVSEAKGFSSELDLIERDADILSLSPEERARLERLHQQEIRRRQEGFPEGGENPALPDPAVEEGGTPSLPPAPDLFQARQKRQEARRKRLQQIKDQQRRSDEEELNRLFEE